MRFLMMIVVAIFIVSGCSTDMNQGTSNNEDNQTIRTRQNDEMNRNNQIAERLERLAKSVPNVKDANCVVIGDTAIVGINVPGNLDRSRVGTIKYSVAEALRKDPDGANAVVTADIDITNRLREMNQDIRKGRPVQGFAEELADIVGRIMPQFPRDVRQNQDLDDQNHRNVERQKENAPMQKKNEKLLEQNQTDKNR